MVPPDRVTISRAAAGELVKLTSGYMDEVRAELKRNAYEINRLAERNAVLKELRNQIWGARNASRDAVRRNEQANRRKTK